ncbi:Aconitate hydratase A [bacterium HR19]|nr:Aconitate hydratase A [bacterium HR19]
MFEAERSVFIDGKEYKFFSLRVFGEDKIKKLPFSLRVLLENLIRYHIKDSGKVVEKSHIDSLIERKIGQEIPFYPERVILQDFTGIPLITDLAVMRDTVKKMGYDPKIINPIKRCDLVIDHSVQVDYFGSSFALELNIKKEFERNRERYIFLKWAQNAFKNFRVIPPGAGIIHQVNLEFLADVVIVQKYGKSKVLFPDTLLGTDSHTTMINALGVLGWGVGGIEAEAVMLGEPYYIAIPEVVGVRLKGKPKPYITSTDIVLYLTHTLRKKGVVDKFVEFFGEGLKNLSLADRATVSNMCPEYGARCAFFPVDQETINYLYLTGRPKKHIEIVSAYLKENMLFQDYSDSDIVEYDEVVEVDLSEIEPTVAGPSRPHDKVELKDIKKRFYETLGREPKEVEVELDGGKYKIRDGSIIISAITSCTNTSNPYLMIGAGLLAKKAVERGLRTPPWVKTSNAPGSRVVTEYLKRLKLLPYLEALGFHITGYGCTVCIGNSGPINSKIEEAIRQNNLNCVAVLSGNRNFEARIHLMARSNFLMSPPLVVAFALAGKIIDPYEEPVGFDPNGFPVFLKDIWPSDEEIRECMSEVSPELFREKYSNIFEGNEDWKSLPSPQGDTFEWDPNSTYIKPPPFFDDFSDEPKPVEDISGARVLLWLGDTITTDHISPAGSIPENSPAGRYLLERGVKKEDFNTYGARRGNWEVMVRGTFANTRLKNLLLGGTKEGGYTLFLGEKELSVFEASELYKKNNIPLLVVAGKEYGAGSSRDWAAKGTQLLGVKAVIAESFETIHRSNLVCMGVVPLQLKDRSSNELKLTGKEVFNIPLSQIEPGKELEIEMIREDGSVEKIKVIAKVNTKVELEYIKHGGILPYVLRKILERSRKKLSKT